jgi:hypothetical protein
VFKYMSADVASLFAKTLKMRFTQPYELNDPFEFRPMLDFAQSMVTTAEYLPTVAAFQFSVCINGNPHYHTLHRFLFTMGASALQWKASWNSGMFETTPLVRYFSGECGSTVARRRLVSSRVWPHQLCP